MIRSRRPWMTAVFRHGRRFLIVAIITLGWLAFFVPFVPAGEFHEQSLEAYGTADRPIIDGAMSLAEALEGVSPECPREILGRQRLITLRYYSFDGKIHQGQLVIDGELEPDIRAVFDVALREKFPIQSVVPISDERFRKDGRWNDDVSMAANNTSGFNYRMVTGGNRLSNHAQGRAIDINPVQNPYIRDGVVLPPGAVYRPEVAGTLTPEHPVTQTFLSLGWIWGGNWNSCKDYQHFEKPRQE